MNNQLETEKNRILDELSQAYSLDSLSLEQYESLVTQISIAPDMQSLQVIHHGLPAVTNNRTISSGESFPQTKTSIAILSGSELKGHFTAATNHQALALLGGIDIDLRDAVIPPQGMTIQALAVLGGVDIIVPERVNVVTSGFGILGGFSSKDNKSHDPNAPTIYIKGLALLGGVEIRVKG